MPKTNYGLVQYAQRALTEKWGYCLGAFGNTLTTSFLTQKCNQEGRVGEYNTKHKVYLSGFMNKRVSDCYGLVKGYVWTDWPGAPKYIAAQDRNQEGAYSAAKEKGSISTIPEIPGLVLWMKGHAGVYIGGGEFIECAGAPKGMQRGVIQGGKVVAGSKFTNWFMDTYLLYLTDYRQLVDACIKHGVQIDLQYWNGVLSGTRQPEGNGAHESYRKILFERLDAV